MVVGGDILGYVDKTPIIAIIDGVVRGLLHEGLLHEGLQVTHNMKIGDIDPRTEVDKCRTISDKARAIGGGVLEALLMSERCFQLSEN